MEQGLRKLIGRLKTDYSPTLVERILTLLRDQADDKSRYLGMIDLARAVVLFDRQRSYDLASEVFNKLRNHHDWQYQQYAIDCLQIMIRTADGHRGLQAKELKNKMREIQASVAQKQKPEVSISIDGPRGAQASEQEASAQSMPKSEDRPKSFLDFDLYLATEGHSQRPGEVGSEVALQDAKPREVEQSKSKPAMPKADIFSLVLGSEERAEYAGDAENPRQADSTETIKARVKAAEDFAEPPVVAPEPVEPATRSEKLISSEEGIDEEHGHKSKSESDSRGREPSEEALLVEVLRLEHEVAMLKYQIAQPRPTLGDQLGILGVGELTSVFVSGKADLLSTSAEWQGIYKYLNDEYRRRNKEFRSLSEFVGAELEQFDIKVSQRMVSAHCEGLASEEAWTEGGNLVRWGNMLFRYGSHRQVSALFFHMRIGHWLPRLWLFHIEGLLSEGDGRRALYLIMMTAAEDFSGSWAEVLWQSYELLCYRMNFCLADWTPEDGLNRLREILSARPLVSSVFVKAL